MIKWITFGVLFLIFFGFFFADWLEDPIAGRPERVMCLIAIIITAGGTAFALTTLIFGG